MAIHAWLRREGWRSLAAYLRRGSKSGVSE